MRSKKLEKYITAALFIGLIILVVWRFDIIDTLSERKEKGEIKANIEAWTKDAKENLKEDFLFLEGKNYFFVTGKLTSECTELDPDSHCPVSMFGAKINGNSLFVEGFNFATPTLDIYPYPITEGINVFGFVEKNHGDSVNLKFEILDYIPSQTLCKTPHDKQELCNIKWTKGVSSDEPIPAESLPVKITDFDYSFLDKELKIFLRGETASNETPDAVLGIYGGFKSKKFLVNQRGLELEYSNGVYGFEFTGTFNIRDSKANYSVLLLVTKENSFYAKEWIFENEKLINTIVYD